MTDTTTQPGFTIKGWHVLVAFVLFFGLIIAVDGVFMTLAYRTFSGEAASNPYETGLLYNRTLAQRRREAALGWSATIEETAGDVLQVRVADRAGVALDGLAVSGALERPATSRGSRIVRFTAAGGGLYRAAPTPLDGAWDLKVTIRRADGAVFEAERRLVRP
jgi:nitrogen fixation protein FixH